MVIWYTGLSGSGKSTIAKAYMDRSLPTRLNVMAGSFNLDGDVMRTGLNSDLGFSEVDRTENIRRLAHMAKYLNDYGDVQVPAITPTHRMRELARDIIGKRNFLLVYVSAPLEICADRDPKGLYKKAYAGEIDNFTGVSALFEIPTDADVVIPETASPHLAVDMVYGGIFKTKIKNRIR